MSKMAISEAHIGIPAGAISQAYVRLRGAQNADISVHHAHTDTARVTLIWGRLLFTFFNAQAAQGVLEGFSAARHSLAGVPADLAPRHQQPYDGPAIAVDWTRRPPYAITERDALTPDKRRTVRWLSPPGSNAEVSVDKEFSGDTPCCYPPLVSHLRYVQVMTQRFAAERAISPTDASSSFVVVDDAFTLHTESCEYLASLRFRDRSVNTERVYAGRIALFLTYCAQNRLDWHCVTVDDLARFQRWLVTEPIEPRGRSREPRLRSNKTANAILTSVCEFLRFASTRGWFPPELVQQLSEPKYLRRGPVGYDFGEDNQFRTVRSRALRLAEVDPPPQSLTAAQIASVLAVLPHVRDRLLVAILAESAMRIGEALGLRREDMHLLASNRVLGCAVRGPHIHVRRRANANGSLAKSRFPRSIPVTANVVDLYADYQFERSEIPEGNSSDFVFVNLYKPPLGEPLRYHNAKKLFERLSESLGFSLSPHMFRHSAATRWLESGTPRDVVQALLGHVSPASMSVYFHPTNETMRAAVERARLTPAGAFDD